MKKFEFKRGFTLIEVVVVMAIIAVLAVLVTGAITVARRTSRETTNRANAKVVQTAMEAYVARNNSSPPPTSEYETIVDGEPYSAPIVSPDGIGQLGTNAISFELIVTNYLSAFGATLAPTPWCKNGDGYANGGGMMNIYRNGAYTIRPYNADCSADGMEGSAIIIN